MKRDKGLLSVKKKENIIEKQYGKVEQKDNQQRDSKKDKKQEKEEDKKKQNEQNNLLNSASTLAKKQTGTQNVQPDSDFGVMQQKKSDIDELNLLRRWDVKIREVKVQSLQKEDMTIFLHIKIGTKKYKPEELEAAIIDQDNSWKQFKSEILKDIKKGETKRVSANFESELHASYAMLEQRHFEVEVWEYRPWKLNLYLGRSSMSLDRLASGNLYKSLTVRKSIGEKRQFTRIYFLAYFQEIWDFNIKFESMRAYNTILKDGQPMVAQLKLTLMTDDVIKPSVESSIAEKQSNPTWDKIDGSIQFRGTIDDLTNQLLEIELMNKSSLEFGDLAAIGNLGNFDKDKEKKTLISLRGIQDFNYLRAQIKLKMDNKKMEQQKKQPLKRKKAANLDASDQENNQSDDEQDIKADAMVYAQIEGRINLHKLPKFIQQGELVRYSKDEYYLCIVVNRCNNVVPPDDRGVVNYYVTVTCGSETKRTKTIYEGANPDISEEMVFKIPIPAKKDNLLQIGDFLQLGQDKDQFESLRDELAKRAEIRFQLWLDGCDIMTDDNLGYTNTLIQDLHQAQLEPRSYVDFQTQRVKYFSTRVGTYTKPFFSSRFDVSRISITYQVYFQPDIDRAIDLRDFQFKAADNYPFQIEEQMQENEPEYNQRDLYRSWENKMKSNFSSCKLDKNAVYILYKWVYVKDQYGRLHLLPKYIDKFSLSERKELEEQDNLKLTTLMELAHYVRSVPFIPPAQCIREIWTSPDFMLNIRRGTIWDHAILMMCLFISCEKESEIPEELDDKQKQKVIPIENRVFIGLGTLNSTKEATAFIVVFNKKLDSVTLWDVQDHFQVTLKGRVRQEERENLRKFLYPQCELEDKKAFNFPFKFSIFGDDEETKKKKQEELKQRKEKEEQALKKKLEEEEKKKLKEEKEAEDLAKEKKYMEVNFDNIEVEMVENKVIELQNVGKKMRESKVQNIKKLMASREQSLASQKSKKSSQSEKQNKEINGSNSDEENGAANKNIEQIQKSEEEEKQNMLASRFTQNNKKSFLKRHKEELQEELLNNDAAQFVRKEEFIDPETGGAIPEDEFEEFIYSSLEILFNHKNLFVNFRNQHPEQIYYHLHDDRFWVPYIPKWNQKIGAFYDGRNSFPPLTKKECQKIQEKIITELQQGINNKRSGEGLATKWKQQEDKATQKLEELLRIIEYRDLGRSWVIYDEKDKKKENPIFLQYENAIEHWQKEMKRLIPVDYSFVAVPMRFLITEPMQIRALIVQNNDMQKIIFRKGKKVMFGVSCKVFNYPNKINCVRLVFSIFFCKSEGTTIEEQTEDQEEDKDGEGNEDDNEKDESDEERERFMNEEIEGEQDKNSKKQTKNQESPKKSEKKDDKK